MEFLNHHIHVVASPIVFVGISTGKLAERLLIGEVLSGDAIGVEVVIEMDAIDIITSDHIGHHSAEMLARLVVARVEIILLAVFHEQLRLAAVDMRGGAETYAYAFGLAWVRWQRLDGLRMRAYRSDLGY